MSDPEERRYYGIYRAVTFGLPKPDASVQLFVPTVFGPTAFTKYAGPIFTPGISLDTMLNSVKVPGTGVWVQFEGGDPEFPQWVALTQEGPE